MTIINTGRSPMKIAETGLIHGDPECQYKHFTAKVGSPIDPDAPIDVECFMTTDSVDADEEVMLPEGIDLSRFNKNPVVMLCHAMGQPGCFYPLPVGRAVWTRRVKRGVLAGVKFSEKSDMGREVKSLFEENMLRSFSVGFRPLEASGMTRKEAESRPDWQEAYERTKGQVRVHRKWSLIELSVAPIPSNPDALVTTYKAKGILVPAWLNLKANTMDEPTPEVEPDEEVDDKAACSCDKDECEACMARKAEDEPDDDEIDDDEPEEVESKAMDDDFDEDDESELPVKTGDHVDVKCKGLHGCGRVEKIHRKGLVEHVDEDMIGTRDDPAARVRLYKAHGDGHRPSETRIAAKLKSLSRRAEPFKEPSKKSIAEIETKAEPLPEIHVQSDQEVRAEMIAKLNAMLSPEGLRKMVREETERITGVV